MATGIPVTEVESVLNDRTIAIRPQAQLGERLNEPGANIQAPQFTVFGKLPSEVRLLIWGLIVHPRVVDVSIRVKKLWQLTETGRDSPEPEYKMYCASTTRLPALLQTCSESRIFPLVPGRYEIVFGGQNDASAPSIYSNFAIDTIRLGVGLCGCFGTVTEDAAGLSRHPITMFEQTVSEEQVRRIRSVAMPLHTSTVGWALNRLKTKASDRPWQALREVHLGVYGKGPNSESTLKFMDISEEGDEDALIRVRVTTAIEDMGVLEGRVLTEEEERFRHYDHLRYLLSSKNRDIREVMEVLTLVGICDLQHVGDP